MDKKYIFIDLDGTILDHNNGGASSSTVEAIRKLQENGHEVIIATGRPPCLFYGVDKLLGIDSFVGANGRIAVYQGEIVYSTPINKKLVHDFTVKMDEIGFDVGYEAYDDYYVNSLRNDFAKNFNHVFRLDPPVIKKDKYHNEDIYQMILYADEAGTEIAKSYFPDVHYSYSNPYGIDVTDTSGLKDLGVKAIVDYLQISPEDCIAVGDGFNDITMLNYVGYGIVMGNAHDDVKKHADMVTDKIEEDGLYKAFERLGLI